MNLPSSPRFNFVLRNLCIPVYLCRYSIHIFLFASAVEICIPPKSTHAQFFPHFWPQRKAAALCDMKSEQAPTMGSSQFFQNFHPQPQLSCDPSATPNLASSSGGCARVCIRPLRIAAATPIVNGQRRVNQGAKPETDGHGHLPAPRAAS